MRAFPSLFALLALALAASAQIHPSLPEPGTLDGLGVNIHFTEPEPGELEMIRAAGFRWVRMDFTWAGTEPEPGRYDFSKYDGLLAALEKAGLRAYFILDYGHPRFGKPDADLIRKPGSQEREVRAADGAPIPDFMASKFNEFPFTSRAGTQEFRDAFAKWAVAAIGHFKGRGIVWELWNEPNIAGFWKPKPDVQQYIALAKTVGAALEKAGLRTKSRNFPPGTKREAAGECLVGPATSLIDLPFLDACFAAGLLDVFDAISVHPYRQGAPESVVEEYRALRLLIRRHCAADALPLGTFDPSRPEPKRRIPILSGEWGYSTAWPSLGKDEAAREATQAKYLPRMFLTNVANDIPLSIWYDWRDDGDDAKEAEHRFGIVRRKFKSPQAPDSDLFEGLERALPFEPKSAYRAMKAMTAQLKGMHFNKRLALPDSKQSLLFSSNERGACLATWCVKTDKFEMPYPTGLEDISEFTTQTTQGEQIGELEHVVYRHAPSVVPRLDLVLDWERLPLDCFVSMGTTVSVPFSVANRTDEQLTVAPQTELLRGVWGINRGIGPDPVVLAARGMASALTVSANGKLDAPHPLSITPACSGSYINQTLFAVQKEGHSKTPFPSQISNLCILDQLTITPLPSPPGTVVVMFQGPHMAKVEGRCKVTCELVQLARYSWEQPFKFSKYGHSSTMRAPLRPADTPGLRWATVDMHLFREGVPGSGESKVALADAFFIAPQPISLSVEKVVLHPDGDAAVASTQSLSDGQPADGASESETPSVRLRYKFAEGWKFVRIELKDVAARKIKFSNSPREFGIWVHGDGQGGVPAVRFRDATGQVHQGRGEPITWKGWRYLTFPRQYAVPADSPFLGGRWRYNIFPKQPIADSGQTMIPLPDSSEGQRVLWNHWGGANDGEVHTPIEWDTLFLLDGNRKAMEGEIFLSAPTLVH